MRRTRDGKEAVQHGIARQAEDVVDAVLLAPRHGLGPAVVAVSPEGEPGALPDTVTAYGGVRGTLRLFAICERDLLVSEPDRDWLPVLGEEANKLYGAAS